MKFFSLALSDTPPHRDIGIAKVVQHPLWNKRTLANDIAILALASKVEFRPGVVPACMPDEYRGRLGYNKQAVAKTEFWKIRCLTDGDCQEPDNVVVETIAHNHRVGSNVRWGRHCEQVCPPSIDDDQDHDYDHGDNDDDDVE